MNVQKVMIVYREGGYMKSMQGFFKELYKKENCNKYSQPVLPLYDFKAYLLPSKSPCN